MSASQKKKLRHEQYAAQMTEKQQKEQKEAKKLRLYTILFTVLIVAMICVAIVTTVVNSGIIERNTTALTVNDHDIKAPELNHYYIDSINSFLNSYGDYIYFTGLDTTAPLDEQYFDEENGETWADYFIEAACENIKAIYAIYDEAMANGYTLSDEAAAEIDSAVSTMALYGNLYGYDGADGYIQAMYGSGCNEDTYRHYAEVQYIASAYATDYNESLVYDDAALREAESENYAAYSSFSYNYFYVNPSTFYEGGTTDEDGNTTYSDEEKAAGLATAKEYAEALASGTYASVEEFDAAIAGIEAYAESSSSAATDYAYSNVSSIYGDWVTDSSRQPGDITCVANESTTTDEDGNTVTNTYGYYVVYYVGSNDNNYLMSNVRHILVAFEGGTTDEDGNTTYSDEEKAAAMSEAEDILKEYLAGEQTEEAFTALALKYSDDTDSSGNVNNEGLYENIVPSSNYVVNFLNWAVDDSRQAGDTGIVESSYGYHVMFYSGDSEQTYRDYMIETDLRSADMTAWEDALLEATTLTLKNTNQVNTSLVLSSN